MVKMVHMVYDDQSVSDGYQMVQGGYTIDILYTLDSASLLVKLKPRIFQRLPPFE
jgi:hypothetical protein